MLVYNSLSFPARVSRPYEYLVVPLDDRPREPLVHHRVPNLSTMNTLARSATRTAKAASRAFSSTGASAQKVCVIGASGGIGQPMSMLLKQSPNVTHLALYENMEHAGVAADLSHICTEAKVTGH